MKHCKMSLLVMAGVFILSVSQAWALSLTVGGSPELFQFTGDTGWIDNPSEGYQLTTVSSIRVDLTDRLMIGDRYELYVNNVLRMTTSVISYALDGYQTGAESFSDAWNSPYLSKGSLLLGPGTYDLDIKAIRVAAGVNYGSGYIRAVGVPEPTTLFLLGIGIFGLGLFHCRKWAQANC